MRFKEVVMQINVEPLVEKIIEQQFRKCDIEQRALGFALLRTMAINFRRQECM